MCWFERDPILTLDNFDLMIYNCLIREYGVMVAAPDLKSVGSKSRGGSIPPRPTWKCGRVAECARLESERGASLRGFESYHFR